MNAETMSPFQLRGRLMDNLKIHAKVPDEKIQILKDALVASNYLLRRDGNAETAADLGRRYYHEDGTEHGFHDVPLEAIVRTVKCYIRSYARCDRPTEVEDKVIACVPASVLSPPPPNPNAEPLTPFSKSKAVSYVSVVMYAFERLLRRSFSQRGLKKQTLNYLPTWSPRRA